MKINNKINRIRNVDIYSVSNSSVLAGGGQEEEGATVPSNFSLFHPKVHNLGLKSPFSGNLATTLKF